MTNPAPSHDLLIRTSRGNACYTDLKLALSIDHRGDHPLFFRKDKILPSFAWSLAAFLQEPDPDFDRLAKKTLEQHPAFIQVTRRLEDAERAMNEATQQNATFTRTLNARQKSNPDIAQLNELQDTHRLIRQGTIRVANRAESLAAKEREIAELSPKVDEFLATLGDPPISSETMKNLEVEHRKASRHQERLLRDLSPPLDQEGLTALLTSRGFGALCSNSTAMFRLRKGKYGQMFYYTLGTSSQALANGARRVTIPFESLIMEAAHKNNRNKPVIDGPHMCFIPSAESGVVNDEAKKSPASPFLYLNWDDGFTVIVPGAVLGAALKSSDTYAEAGIANVIFGVTPHESHPKEEMPAEPVAAPPPVALPTNAAN